jgi:alpha-L-arabinofuranosidase
MTKSIFQNVVKRTIFICLALCFVFICTQSTIAQTTITIQADKRGISISPHLWGIFFEDLNWAADGGLYGELVQNRSFEYINAFGSNFTPTTAWTLIQRGGASASMTLGSQNPLNSANPHYLTLSVSNGGNGAGLSNSGYGGIPVTKGSTYHFSFWAKQNSGRIDTILIRIESTNGTLYSDAKISGLTSNWAQYTVSLTCNVTDSDARLLVLSTETGSIDMDMISLFPVKTFKNRENGLRADLAQRLVDLKPKFIRFPGGCIVHSNNIATAYRWKETIGPVEARKTNSNRWGYMQSCGLGFYEYFQLCEDLGAEPLPVLPVGVSCHWKTPYEVVPMNSMKPWVDDALDLIEYANGPATSTWGAKRAQAGHPEPFNLKYIAVGNEEWGPEFKERSDLFITAIRAKYPDIKIVGTAGPNVTNFDYTDLWNYNRQAKSDLVDEHFYMDLEWFKQNTHRYDSFDRNGPKVFAGEYASGILWATKKTLSNAVAEAAFMTGMERNSDVVQLSCYAPLFRAVHCNGAPAEQPWDPDLIYFNNHASFGTPSYYAQLLFANNTGHYLLPINLDTTGANGPIFGVCSKDTVSGDIILKVVNTSNQTITDSIRIQAEPALQRTGVKIVMTSANLLDENGFEQPEKVAPVVSKLDSVSASFQTRFLPNSITILRLATRPPVAIGNVHYSKLDVETHLSAHIISGNRLSVSLNLPKSTKLSAKLVDCSGKAMVNLLQQQVFEKGNQHIVWQLPHGKTIRNGMYILIVSINGQLVTIPCVNVFK